MKAIWEYIKKTITHKRFVYLFPLAVFVVLAFILKSIIMVCISAIWMVTIIYADEEEISI